MCAETFLKKLHSIIGHSFFMNPVDTVTNAQHERCSHFLTHCMLYVNVDYITSREVMTVKTLLPHYLKTVCTSWNSLYMMRWIIYIDYI